MFICHGSFLLLMIKVFDEIPSTDNNPTTSEGVYENKLPYNLSV